MMQLNNHFRQVELWVEEKLKDRPQGEVIDIFDKAFRKVWGKAELTLGSVTMQAVADRVVHIGREAYPWLASIHTDKDGIDVTELAQHANPITDDELRLGLGFLMGEFLRVLGSLTAEIISSKLHALLKEEPAGPPSESKSTAKLNDAHSPVAKGGKK